jgi:hypothetical protein
LCIHVPRVDLGCSYLCLRIRWRLSFELNLAI